MNPCPLSHIYGGVVRLAFHDAVGTGGPNGCIDFTKPENNGLQDIVKLLNKIYAPYANLISKADFWVLAANLVIQYATTTPPPGKYKAN